MTQFCSLFLGIYALLAPQRGGHGTMPPPKIRPGMRLFHRIMPPSLYDSSLVKDKVNKESNNHVHVQVRVNVNNRSKISFGVFNKYPSHHLTIYILMFSIHLSLGISG